MMNNGIFAIAILICMAFSIWLIFGGWSFLFGGQLTESELIEHERQKYHERQKMMEQTAQTQIAQSNIEPEPNVGVVFGCILFSLGLAIICWSFLFDPSVSTTPIATELAGYSLPDRTINLGQLGTKLMICITGCAFLVSGTVFIACSRRSS